MIGKLRGTVDAVGESHCIIDVGGVGYEVQASARALQNMTVGAEVSLTIDTHVREDAIRLYGFASEIERGCFRMLQSVQGVGAKVALGVLGVLAPDDLSNAISAGDWAAVSQTPGIGKKIAQRIVTELKDKVPSLSIAGPSGAMQGHVAGTASANVLKNTAVAEAVSALCNLGYQPVQASQAVTAAAQELGEKAETAELIRNSLKALSR